MQVLVIGGAGYIGSQTVKALKKDGFNPIVLDNLSYGNRFIIEKILKVPLIIGQAGDKELLRSVLLGKHPKTNSARIDAIIHFAGFTNVGESVEDPIKYYRNNLIETLNLLEVLVEQIKVRKNRNIKPFRIPIVFSSTCATYGIPDIQNIPISEKTPQYPANPYGKTKFMIEQIFRDFYIAYNLSSICLRYFNVAGADPECEIGENHVPETHLIPLIFDTLRDDNKSIKILGNDYPTPDGTCIRDYIHVYDLAHAHILALKFILKKDSCVFYNLGSGKGYSVLEVIKMCEKVTNLKVKTTISSRREGDPPILISSSKKIIDELGWKPCFPDLEIIIKHAWEWYKKMNFK